MTAAQPRRPNPFVGPHPFSPGEPLFGRDREVRTLRNLLVAERIVVLYSPSGAGKTSLVQAGLIPKMRDSDFHVLPVIRVNKPPGDPANGYANRYLESAVRSLEPDAATDAPSPVDLIDVRFSDVLARRPRPDDDSVADLLIFDQFEEILTLDPTDVLAKTEFFAHIGEALQVEDRWAIFSLREDHRAGLEPYLPLIPTRLTTSFRLEFLSREAAVEVMRKTAREGGITFEEDAANLLAEDLSRVRVQHRDQPRVELMGNEVEPVQLQVVCHRLWNHLPEDTDQIDRDAVAGFGRVDDALGAFYEESLAAVAEETKVPEREIRTWVDDHLITKRGIRGQILWEQDEDTGLDDAVIEALIDTHLVRAESRRGATWLELAHDRLIEPVVTSNAAWFAANLAPFQRQARLWDEEPPEQQHLHLLSEEGLAVAEAWLVANPGVNLTPAEREFLITSRERHLQVDLLTTQREFEAERRTKRKLAGLTAALFVVFLVALGAAAIAKQRGDEQARLTLANLAGRISGVEVPDRLAQHDQRDDAALLARQAYFFEQESGLQQPSQVVSALNNVLAPPPYSWVVGYHDGGANAVAVSPDGRLLASAGADGRVLLRDLERQELDGDPLTTPRESNLSSVAFSSDGRLLAVSGCQAAPDDGSGCTAPGLRVWDLEDRTWTPPAPANLPGEVVAVTFDPAPGSHRLVLSGQDGTFWLWDLDDEAGSRALTLPSGMVATTSTMLYSPDGSVLAVGACLPGFIVPGLVPARVTGEVIRQSCGVLTYDASNVDAAPKALRVGAVDVTDLAFSPDGSQLAASTSDNSIMVWNGPFSSTEVNQDPIVAPISQDDSEAVITSLAWLDDETLLFGDWIGGRGIGMLGIWHPRRPEISPLLSDRNSAPSDLVSRGVVRAVAAVPGSHLIAIARSDGTVSLREILWSRAAPAFLDGHPRDFLVSTVAFSPDGTLLASAESGDWTGMRTNGRVLLWRLGEDGPLPIALPLKGARLRGPAANPGEPCDDAWVYALVIDPLGNRLAVGYSDGTIQVWTDLAGASPVQSHSLVHGDLDGCVDIRGLAFDPTNPDILASVGWDDGTVRLWDLGTPSGTSIELAGATVENGAFRSVAFSDDGRLAAAGCSNRPSDGVNCDGGHLLVWENIQADPVPVCCDSGVPGDAFYSVAFGPTASGSQILAAGTWDGRVKSWRRDGESFVNDMPDFTGHRFSVRALVFSEDGTFLFSSSDDGTVRRWPLAGNDAPELVLSGQQPGLVRGIALHGSTLAAGSSDGTVRLWSLDAAGMAEAVCARVRGNLDPQQWKQYVSQDVAPRATCPDLRVASANP